jgi:hypothetical protein
MKRIEIAVILSIILSTFSLGFGFFMADGSEFSILIIVLSLFFLFGYWFKFYWTSHIFLVINFVFICLGIFISIPIWILLITLIGVIVYWDLLNFTSRVNNLKNADSIFEIEEKHLRRLLIVILCMGLITSIPLILEIQLNFIFAVFLSLVAVVGLSQAVRFYNRSF